MPLVIYNVRCLPCPEQDPADGGCTHLKRALEDRRLSDSDRGRQPAAVKGTRRVNIRRQWQTIVATLLMSVWQAATTAAQSADYGATLYRQHCASCHGERGNGRADQVHSRHRPPTPAEYAEQWTINQPALP